MNTILFVLLGTGCLLLTAVDATKQLQEVDVFIPFNQLMTPQWIESNAEITGNHELTKAYYKVLPTTGASFQRALRVPLIPPNVVNSNDSITIVIIVSMNTTIPQSQDHDPNFGISDGISFIGFEPPDVLNYPTASPCLSIDGTVDSTTLQNPKFGYGPLTTSTHYPSVVKMQFKPNEQWGCCETPQGDGGYSTLGFYQYALDPKNGLNFELYRHNPGEEYFIKYIQVYVQWE